MSDTITEDPKPRLPHYAERESARVWLAHEIWDHLWPWTARGFRRQRFLQAASLGAAILVTITWLQAAAGRIGPGAVIGWWLGWSAFEIAVRMQSKPYVKEGPWWGRSYRAASLMDMLCYVLFKNLLIGMLLFILLRVVGVLDILHALPALKWLYQ